MGASGLAEQQPRLVLGEDAAGGPQPPGQRVRGRRVSRRVGLGAGLGTGTVPPVRLGRCGAGAAPAGRFAAQGRPAPASARASRASIRAKPRRLSPCQPAGDWARSSSPVSPMPQTRSRGLASTSTREAVARR